MSEQEEGIVLKDLKMPYGYATELARRYKAEGKREYTPRAIVNVKNGYAKNVIIARDIYMLYLEYQVAENELNKSKVSWKKNKS